MSSAPDPSQPSELREALEAASPQPGEVRQALKAAAVRPDALAGFKNVAAGHSNAAAALAASIPLVPSGLAAGLAAIESSAAGRNGVAATLAAIEKSVAGRTGVAAALAAIPPMPKHDLAAIPPIPSINVAALRANIDGMNRISASIADAGRDRARREAAVAEATVELVQVANAQRIAINALVAEAQSAATTERRRFKVTLAVALVVMVAAIIAAVPVLLSIR
jgi:hypothetical protein